MNLLPESPTPVVTTMTDNLELLAVRCQLGERQALDALVARWHLPLWKYARRLTGGEEAADDVVQDVWLRILRGLPGLREPARLRPWIFGIARRVLMDRLRAQYAAPPIADVDVGDRRRGVLRAQPVHQRHGAAALRAGLPAGAGA